jgi:hypothetical protein
LKKNILTEKYDEIRRLDGRYIGSPCVAFCESNQKILAEMEMHFLHKNGKKECRNRHGYCYASNSKESTEFFL